MYYTILFSLKVLEEVKVSKEMDRDTLISVARTSLRTKLHTELADLLTEVTVQNNFYNLLVLIISSLYMLQEIMLFGLNDTSCSVNLTE